MTLWLAVTHDQYELPICVMDSAEEMAKWAGLKKASVWQQSSRNKRKGIDTRPAFRGKYRIRSVEVEEDEEC